MGVIKDKLKNMKNGGFFHVFFGNILVKLIAFISSIVIVRLVSKDSYAYLTYADNLYNYVICCVGLGMPSAILKFCVSEENTRKCHAYFLFAMKYGSLFQAILSISIVLYSAFFPIPFPKARGIIYLLILYPALLNALNTVSAYLRARAENILFARVAVVQTIVLFAFSVGLVRFIGVNSVPVARYIAIIVALLILLKFFHKEKIFDYESLSHFEIKAFMVMSLSLMFANIFSLIMPVNEMTLVNVILHNETITANYKIAILIPGQLSFVTQSILIYYFTIIAKLKSKKEIWQLSKKVGIVNAIVIAVITVIGIIFTPLIVRVAYGPAYDDAMTLSVFFWIVYALNAGFRMIPMNLLPAIGIAKMNAYVAMISCFLHLGLTTLFIYEFGIWGAGIGTGIIYIVSGLFYWKYYYKKCFEEE